MDDFGDNFDQPEVDPAADFLARQQNQLEGLEDELGDAIPSSLPIIKDEPMSVPVYDNPSPTPMMRSDKEEPEKIKAWREEQKIRIEEKDAEEELKKEEMRISAKKELEDWYNSHEEQISKTKAANRNAEKQFVAESDEMEPGTEWERIAKLCDFNPKSTKSSKDVSRMRSIILQLKQTNLVTPKKA